MFFSFYGAADAYVAPVSLEDGLRFSPILEAMGVRIARDRGVVPGGGAKRRKRC